MKGIELARKYFETYGLALIERDFSEYSDRFAAGLVGHGSECFGFDDEISKDHDFDASFCIWLTEDDYKLFGFRLERALSKLPKKFEGVSLQKKSRLGFDGKGVFTIPDFYKRYTSFGFAPQSLREWLYTPSEYLAEATNGEVFYDKKGEFTAIRNEILYGMPEDVRLKKIASKAIFMASTGQYNAKRCLLHNDPAAAVLSLSKFAEHSAQMVFLLNKKHAPYYKWILKGAEHLPILGDKITLLRQILSNETSFEEKEILVESFCGEIIAELHRQNLSNSNDSYLEAHAFSVNDKIKDGELRNMHIMTE